MATIHPSRLGLVPHSEKELPKHRRRSPSPRRRSLSRDRGYDRHQDSRNRDYRNRDDDRDRGRRRDHDRRNHEEDAHGRMRRASPAYEEYKRPGSPPPPPPRENGSAPWRREENMYPQRRDRGYGGGGEGGDFFESRRQQRANSTLSIWPPSPKAPSRTLSPGRDSKSRRKHKRSRSYSLDLSSTDNEEEHRRRRKKEKRRSQKDQDKDRDRSERKKRTRSPSRSRTPERKVHVDEPKPDSTDDRPLAKVTPSASIAPPSSKTPAPVDDSDEELGPMPPSKVTTTKKVDERAYGGALLRGEGSAMAAFLQDGTDMRIPRRGEIGLTSDEIAKYEDAGYVMSGSRHRVMNAVRMRKENQVISAEEKRGILKLQQEERERREMILREEFQELLQEKLKGTEGGRGA